LKNHKTIIANKRKNLTNFIFFIFIIIAFRYFYIQVVTNDQYKESASKNNFTKIKSIPPRGIIYDRNGQVVVANRSSFSIKIYPLHYDKSFNIDLFFKIINSADKRSKLLINKDLFSKSINKNKNNSVKKYKLMNIINFIDFKTKALLSENKNDFPGLVFSSNPSRYYEDTPNLSHVLGYLRPVNKDSVRKDGFYSINDIIGISGIEKIYENNLRGKKGVNYHVINTFGKDLGIDKNKSIPFISGEDIFLSIDCELQAFIEGLLSGYKGSIICMNPKNGDILAMASAPDYSLSQFIGPLKTEVWEKWKKEKRLVNRATQGRYPPGSLYKLVTSIMFIDKQLDSLNKTVFCNGKFELEDQSNPGNPKIYRCWNKTGHGKVNLHDAIVQSCNVYFYEMILEYQEKNKFIINDLHKYAEMLGLNKKTGIELPEKEGRIPNSDWMVINQGKSWPKRGSMPNLAIGQGANSITPIQAINLVNFIAMRGEIYKPRLVLGEPQKSIKSKISKYVWDEIQNAMYDVVNTDKGTASIMKRNDAIIRGKTGTAQTKSSSISDDLLSWFAGYMETEDDLISLVVLIEDANSQTKSIGKVISKKIFNYIVESKK
jgi:penicillin-binding protein 2